ncbi:MAG: hypothetical protein E7K64_00775 [Clostridia bacterium]|nr:hypothetical protein [Clostridiales bacterium]MDU7504565.1 hypothetical protein [Clostridia bacterium]
MRQEYILSWNNRENVLKLPVNPQEVPSLTRPGHNTTWTTTDIGSFKAIGKAGLAGLTLASFFPAHEYTFCTYQDFPKPMDCVRLIERWQSLSRPIRLIITGYLNMAFAIEGFEWSVEKGTGDINFKLELEEYRFANTPDNASQLPVQDNNGLKSRYDETAPVDDEAEKDTVIEVTVQSQKDTLWHTAELYLEDATRWKEIAELNKIADPKLMQKGQVVKIKVPARSKWAKRSGPKKEEKGAAGS